MAAEEDPVKIVDDGLPMAKRRPVNINWLYGSSYFRNPLRIVDHFGVYANLPTPRKQHPWLYGSHFARPLPVVTYDVVMDAGLALGEDMLIRMTTPSNATVIATGRSQGNTTRQ